ncbi:MAG: hypothetical protein QOI23_1025 [Chloroflexota bacterium]|nr:hypothetical protein [Chloroflexota bacterium]
MDSTREDEGALTSRLEELGVGIGQDQMEELSAAYPALLTWTRIARDLADEPLTPAAEK